jgi:hypothetical protein
MTTDEEEGGGDADPHPPRPYASAVGSHVATAAAAARAESDNSRLRRENGANDNDRDWDWLFDDRDGAAREDGVVRTRRVVDGAMAASPSPRENEIASEEHEHDGENDVCDPDTSVPEPLKLPKSTHTLLFSQPMHSFPFAFAGAIALVCLSCLCMALANNVLKEGGYDSQSWFMGAIVESVPANVSSSVRAAQYLSILIAMMMESEIPTGLMLLRNVPQSSYRAKFPRGSYSRFVGSAILRIILGYLFLINVFVVMIQAKEVLEIFYNILALEFLIQLDDISFVLSKMDVLGKRMRLACTARLFDVEFEKAKRSGRGERCTGLCLKSVYFANIVIGLGLLTSVAIGQSRGSFQCRKITVDLGDGVWEDPILNMAAREHGIAAKTALGINMTVAARDWNDFTLVFSYFNGVYEQDGTHHGRPIYRERRKFDNGPFDSTWGTVPAEIRYSNKGGFWVFTHPWIRKSDTEDDVSSHIWRGIFRVVPFLYLLSSETNDV